VTGSTPPSVEFPLTDRTERSTTTTGRAVVAEALRSVDPVGSRAVEHETAWRSGYVVHFRRLVEAGLGSAEDWTGIARAGLDAAWDQMCLAGPEDEDVPLRALLEAAPRRRLETVEVVGSHEPDRSLGLPYHGARLTGAALDDRLDEWTRRGVLEPSAADAVREVAAHPEWLSLPGHTVAVLGAAAEMGPLTALLRWGATVAAADLPRPEVWDRVLAGARDSAGRLLVAASPGAAEVSRRAGADLLCEVPELADWLVGLEGRLVVGNYLYADGGTHVRLSMAADVLGRRVSRDRADTALAFLATPTDVFAVPGEAVEQANRSYAERSGTARVVGRPLRWASRGRLLHRAYPPGADPGIADSLVPVQGPSYALAKRLQRWRATAARQEGQTVSLHVAPATRTRSVVKNRALAAAYAGAHRFGVEVFDPGTANVLMAALLVHDLMAEPQPSSHTWRDEARGAVHGGLWRSAYEPRSALGLAALLGFAASRT
jgi:hypothetical protein